MKTDPNRFWIEIYERDPEQAWQDFLETNDELIKRIIRRLVKDYDDQMELYAYTLEQLKSNGCQKLNGYFDKHRSFNFQTWIAVVVRNCCMDWFRQRDGRKRLLKSIEELSPLDQQIFKYIYQQGFSIEAALGMVNNLSGKKMTFVELASRSEEIKKLLQKKTRWKLENEWKEILPALSLESFENGERKKSQQVPSQQNNPDPENQFLQSAALKKLQEMMANLPTEDKLILHLHFYKGLTLKEIARILKLRNVWQVHRKLHKVLNVLQQKMQKENIELSDMDFS
jgi:RNA polymerase sigma factor (sigma-70 family)